jgi:hypothetical protein
VVGYENQERGITMKMKYSKKGVPFIELDNDNKLVFSPTTSTPEGYKWMMFSGISTTTETLSGGKGAKKTKRKIKVTHPVSTLIDMEFANMGKSAKNANMYLTKRYLSGVKKMFEPFVVNGVFLYENVSKLSEYINKQEVINKEDLLDDDPMGYYEDDEEEYE